MLHLGDVPANSTLYIPFATYAGSTGASITLTGLATTDILLYKNGSVTQRSSSAGYTLLDTDGIDFDGLTGIHGFSIDLSDNTDAGFYAVGSFYWVVVSSVTVDSQTVNFVAATFRVVAAEAVAGKPKVDVDAWLGTAAATPTVAGVPEVDVTHSAGEAVTNADGTLAAATATTVTFPATDAAGRSVPNDARYEYTVVQIVSGTGFGQTLLLTTRVGATREFNVLSGSMPVTPSTDSEYAVVGSWRAALEDLTAAGETALRDALGLASANLDTQLTNIQSDTNDLQSRVPAALVGGNMSAVLADGVTHGGTTAKLRLGSSTATPALHATNSGGDAVEFTSTLGRGLYATGTTYGGLFSGGTGLSAQGSNGYGVYAIATGGNGDGVRAVGNGTGDGFHFEGGATGDGAHFTAPGGVPIRGNITGNLSGSVGSVAAGGITSASFGAGAITSTVLDATAGAEIADAVWDEAIAGHLTGGSTGNALNAAGAAGDPWTTSLPGAYTVGTAGYIVGTNVDALISSRLAPTTAGRTLDVAATGEAGLDFDNVKQATGATTLTNVTVPTVTTAGTVSALGTQAKADVNAEVVDCLTVDTYAEVGQEAPAATTTLRKMLAYLYKAWRNKKTQTSSQYSLFADDATTVDQKATVADDGTTTTVGEVTTGP